ncbi:MAG: 16S rRNA (cytidine(1402)-2'-O)-methyltransferase, partial [Bacteroidota bacterium]
MNPKESDQPKASGILSVVSTPLGNLGDITARSLELLRTADLVLCEDTRTTGMLLKHLGIQAVLKSYHAYHEHVILDKLLEQLQSGAKMVLVSDAGTPGISDPGFLLIRHLLQHQIKVDVAPGPSAILPALLLSGFPCDRFVFEGFLPLKKGRATRINALKTEARTIILYESPHRILRTVKDLAEILGPDRQACLARELTKIHQ